MFGNFDYLPPQTKERNRWNHLDRGHGELESKKIIRLKKKQFGRRQSGTRPAESPADSDFDKPLLLPPTWAEPEY